MLKISTLYVLCKAQLGIVSNALAYTSKKMKNNSHQYYPPGGGIRLRKPLAGGWGSGLVSRPALLTQRTRSGDVKMERGWRRMMSLGGEGGQTVHPARPDSSSREARAMYLNV